MVNEHSVSQWLAGIKAGDEASIEQLWHRYFERLVRLARGKLPGHCRRAFDEEDVALSAFQSFCQRAAGGQFPKLSDRNDLWRLLLTLTLRKAVLTIRHQTRRKRGGGRVMGESAFQDGNRTALGLAGILEDGPSPEDAVLFADDVERRLEQLKDKALQNGRPAKARRLQRRGDCDRDRGIDQDRRTQTSAYSCDVGGGNVGMNQWETRRGRPALADLHEIDAVCDRFEKAWRSGQRPDIAEFLADVPVNARAAVVSRSLEPRPRISPPARRAARSSVLL